MLFYKGYMEGIEDAVSRWVPKAISLGVGSITNKETRKRTMKDFWVVTRDKGKGLATNFPEVGKRRNFVVLELIRCFTVIGRRACKVSEISSGSYELIPHVWRRIASNVHSMHFVHKGMV